MIRRIEALNYRSLRYVSQEIRPFQILVGPNATGKSTFLDVPALLSDFLRDGQTKPTRPKELLETLTVRQKIPRSASLYVAITEKVSLRRCQDASFQLLTRTLQTWFPQTGAL